jgi:hypothetical protein
MNRRNLASAVREHLKLAAVAPFPSGITPDNAANFGLFALQANANLRMGGVSLITTAGTDTTLTAAQALSRVIVLAAGASAGFTITLPTAAALIGAMGPTVPKDGSFITILSIQNFNVGQTGTITASTGITVIGTATIATNTTRTVYLRVLDGTSMSLTNMGSMAL